MLLYNSLTRTKENIKPLSNNIYKIYVCGITPYDTTHLGHAFTYISFDVLIRYLRFKGFDILYTQNVTDIDDDMLKRAKLEGKDWKKLGEFWTKKFLSDMKILNVLPPTHYVKATESMDTIISIVQALEENGFAYEQKGNVYFRTNAFKQYGKLSKLNHHQMLQLLKERGGDPNDQLKEAPLDFLLWQKSKKTDPFWKSPWGKGRPGWHIECSSMIYDYLGEQIDIHGGGRDLIYPHHESEIAQSESFTYKRPFTKTWMHTAMLMHEGEKMSKSLGNLIMVSELLKTYSPNAIRYMLLSHHYRKPWEFDLDELVQAEDLFKEIKKITTKKYHSPKNESLDQKEKKPTSYLTQFKQSMEDDLDTPMAMELIARMAKKINSTHDTKHIETDLKVILEVTGFAIE
jgi:L-cysteine:1D-myo-inositol 2-amino-2-deoxy-alpha-D-glucopyranoside ligase